MDTAVPWPADQHPVVGERQQRGDHHQEYYRERGQKDGQGDLVGGLLALGAFDELDHAVEKALPGSAVTRTTSQSESTLVPPVTALRSPPDSRMTGALSPVTALSSTRATPAITSPSAGTVSPASMR